MKKPTPMQIALQMALILTDVVAVYCGYIISYVVYFHWFGHSPQSFDEIASLAIIPAGMTVLSFFLTSVYRCQPGPLGLNQLRRLLSAYFWSGMVTFSLTFFTKTQGFSRIMVSLGFILGVMFVLLGRAFFVSVASRLRHNLQLNRKILILGAGKVGTSLARNLLTSSKDFEIIGFLDDQFPTLENINVRIGEWTIAIPVLGRLDQVEDIVKQKKISDVIVAMTNAAHALHQSLLERAKELEVSFSIVPSALELMLTGAEAYSIGRIPLFRIGEKPTFILSPFLKRCFDILGAIAIGILSSPIWIISVILIKVGSKGPALFVHQRVGKDGKLFDLFKFRSMDLSADPYAVTPMTQMDPRITKIGRIIRRSSIDEIPQLLNVLKGDMSLVGPRPEMPFIVDTYDDLQRMRLSVKPGLTGVWQISADRANPIHENIDYDLYYLENQSLWLDLAILVKTFTSVIKGVGAY